MREAEKRLVTLFGRLPVREQESLLDFAEFLAVRAGSEAALPPSRPEPIPRPAQESVIAALKRLSATYPMIDSGRVLHEASQLVSQHMVGGEEAEKVIDALEALFDRHYRKQCEGEA